MSTNSTTWARVVLYQRRAITAREGAARTWPPKSRYTIENRIDSDYAFLVKADKSAGQIFVFRTKSRDGNPDTRYSLQPHPTGQSLPYFGRIELNKPEPPREMHSHPTFEIHFVARGKMAFDTPRGPQLLARGDAFVAAPNMTHGNGPFTHVRTTVFTLMLGVTAKGGLTGVDPEHSPALRRALEKISGRVLHTDPALRGSFQKIAELAENPSPFAPLEFRTTMTEILLRLVEKGGSNRSGELSAPIRKGVAYLREKAVENPDLSALARSLHLSPSGFRHRFRHEVGISPKEYHLREKVHHAASAVRGGVGNLTKIALHSGFSSSQHFSRIFKKYTGQSPSAYRENPKALI